MPAHDLLSPSAAHRWLACAASPALCEGMPEEPSPWAEEGTRAHELAQQAVLNTWGGPEQREDLDASDEEMLEAACAWVDVLRSYLGGEVPDVAYCWGAEARVDLLPVLERDGAGGTADFYAVQNGGRLLVADFKYGRGVPVEAERNPQLMLYAAGFLARFSSFGIDKVRLLIFQPRTGVAVKVWDTTAEEVRKWVKTVVSPAVARCKDALNMARMGFDLPEAWYSPGEAQCRFCRAKFKCCALRNLVKDQIAADFDLLPAPAPEAELDGADGPALPVPETDEQLARAIPWLDVIEQWVKATRGAAVARLQEGGDIPGYKLVAGRRGPRRWTDDAQAVLDHMRIGKKVLYEPKLISPTAAEKAFKRGDIGPRQWREIERHITRSEGALTLVPASDERPALEFKSVAADFEDRSDEIRDLF